MNPNDPDQTKGGFPLGRRQFVKGAALAGAAAFTEARVAMAKAAPESAKSDLLPVPKKPLGKTGIQVSALGVGGFHLGTAKDQEEASAIVAEAIDAGINFFDNAWEYHNGESEVRLGNALKGKRDQVVLMTKVCTHGRGKNVAMGMLEIRSAGCAPITSISGRFTKWSISATPR